MYTEKISIIANNLINDNGFELILNKDALSTLFKTVVDF